MHPVLFTIPGIEKDVHIYGVMIAAAAIMAAHFSTKQAIKKGLPVDFFNDLVFWVLVAGIVGSRLEYMRVNWDQFSGDLGASVRIWEGGLVFYGGLIAALFASTEAVKVQSYESLYTVLGQELLYHLY